MNENLQCVSGQVKLSIFKVEGQSFHSFVPLYICTWCIFAFGGHSRDAHEHWVLQGMQDVLIPRQGSEQFTKFLLDTLG